MWWVEWLKGLVLTAAIFVPLERLLALNPNQKIFRRGWLNDTIYLLVNGQIINLVLSAFAAGIIITAGWFLPSGIRAFVAGQPTWLQIIEIIILSDVGFYLAHRAFHAVPGLWKFHAVHHSIEELDWLAGARVHPIDQIITKAAGFLPVFSLGFSDLAIGISLIIYGWQSFFVHSNIRITFGPFRWVFATPEFHHWHHAKDPEARDKNFAGQLPILDVIFGTLHMPHNKKPSEYGIDQPMPATYLSQLSHPFRSSSASPPQLEASRSSAGKA
jgi:sterol desaturase/sphingolipid hydroxylase (fatty acid hydroxylase superfamily)